MSAIRVSELEGPKRIDAEYWNPTFLRNEARLDEAAHCYSVRRVFELVRRITGSAFYPSIADDYSFTEGMPFIRVADLSEFFVKQDTLTRIPEELVREMRQIAKVNEGDILVAKGGSIGGVSLVQSGLGRCATSRDVIAIETDSRKIDSIYLTAFLLSKPGQLQLERYKSQQVQAHLTFPAIGNVRVVVPDRQKQEAVAGLVRRALEQQDLSRRLYSQAQTLLAAELGLDKLDLSEGLFSVRRISEVVEAGRTDAEYYRPKYQRLLEHLQNTGQAVRLGNWVCEPLKRGVQPEYAGDGEILVINSQHVGKTHIELEDNRLTTREFCEIGSNQRACVRQYDVLLNSTGYITIGRCQTLLDDVKAIVDGHVTVIRPKEGLDPVYLGLFLNALPGQMQTERGWTGSSGQIELRAEVIADFLVWKAPDLIQRRIRHLLEQSHQASRVAKRLLAEAKAEVERIIGDGNT